MCAFAFIGAGTRSGMSVLHPSNTIVDSSALVQTAWSQAWKEDVRNAFTGAADGGSLHGNLIADASGALYGTTSVVGSVRPCQQGCGGCFQAYAAVNCQNELDVKRTSFVHWRQW
jgi:hypothetical protein